MEDYIMNIQRSERVLETIPVGSLGIIALPSCKILEKEWTITWCSGVTKALISTKIISYSRDTNKSLIS